MARKKKKKNNGRVFWIALIFLVVAVAFGFLISYGVQQTTLASGFVVKSIVAPNYKTDNPDLSQYDWRIVANIVDGSENIVYTMSPEEFERFSGVASENEFKIEMRSFDEEVSYNVRRQTTIPDYEYTYTKATFTPDPCPEGASYQFVEDNEFPRANVRHCLYVKRHGFKGILEKPEVGFNAEMTLTASGTQITREITEQDSVVTFEHNGEDLAKAQWTGSLITGDPLPQTNNLVAVLPEGDQWHLISEDNWDDYKTAENSFIRPWNEGVTDFDNRDVDNLIEQFQTELDAYKTKRSNLLGDEERIQGSSWSERSDVSNAKMLYEIDTRFSVPEIVFDVRADWVGIEIESGQPNIIDASCSPSTSGGENIVSVDVENVGNDGTFAIRKEGCPSFKQEESEISTRFPIDSNEEKTEQITLKTGSLNEDVTETCTIIVSDVADPDRQDSENVECSQEALQTCNPGEQITRDDDCIYECNDEGNGYDKVKCCQGEPVLQNGVYVCPEGRETEGGFFSGLVGGISETWDQLKSGNLFTGFAIGGGSIGDLGTMFQILFILITILITIGSYYALQFFRAKFKINVNKYVVMIMSGLIGIIIYILLFELFWVIVILGVIGTLIYYFIRKRL